MVNLNSLILNDQVIKYSHLFSKCEKYDIEWAYRPDVFKRRLSKEEEKEVTLGVLEDGMDIDVYFSRSDTDKILEWHRDLESVLIICTYGSVSYMFEVAEREYKADLKVGDALSIPSGVPHCPVHVEPRVCLSIARYS